MAFSFDGPSKTISLTSGTVILDVRDLWSRWVEWFLTGDNSKFIRAFDFVGGETIDQTAGTFIPIYAFIKNGWKIKPQEANHTLNVVNGILIQEGGGDPFLNTLGNYIVRINYSQPVQAITVAVAGDVSTSIMSEAIETGFSFKDAMRLMLSAMAGKVSGGGTNTIRIRDIGDSKNRITATVDNNGNRTNVTYNTTD